MLKIGVSGGTCSGKSTLAASLTAKLVADGVGVKLINMDSYFKASLPTTIAPITRKEYPEHNHPDALDLDRLYRDIDDIIAADDVAVLIIEGLFALYLDRVRELLDLKIFVDLRSDERFARRIKRFSEQFGQSFDEICERYLDTVRFRHDELIEPSRWHADVIINGTLDSNNGTALLEQLINLKLQLAK